jgi:hypothetical protein
MFVHYNKDLGLFSEQSNCVHCSKYLTVLDLTHTNCNSLIVCICTTDSTIILEYHGRYVSDFRTTGLSLAVIQPVT